MATARHFGVKPTNSAYNVAGYGDEAFLLVQNSAADQNSLGQVPSNPGVVWYVGPDEDVHTQIIAYTVHDAEGSNGGSYPTLFNSLGDQGDDNNPGEANTARIAFKGNDGRDWTNSEFIALVDEIANLPGNGPTAINNITDAVNYINNGSHWTNFTGTSEATTTEAPPTTYDYYTIRPCGRVQTFTLRVDQGIILPEGSAHQTNAILWVGDTPEEFIGISSYVVVGPAEDENHVGYDPAPKSADCTE